VVASSVASTAPAFANKAAPSRKSGPIDTKLTLDQPHAVGVQITTAAGGVIVVSGRKGAKVTLTFPAGSVPEDTLVTATPITKTTGRFTSKGMLAGVQLQPEGLNLLKPATARFARRGKAKKGTRLVFVGTQGDGRDLYRLPPPTRTRGKGKKRVVVPVNGSVVSLSHFSTVQAFDWSQATLAELDAINHPAVGLDQLSQNVSKLLTQKPPVTVNEINEVMDQFRTRFIVPLVDVAAAGVANACSARSIARARSTMQIVFTFERQAQLLGGGEEGNAPQIAASLLTGVGNCMSTLCVQLADPRVGNYLLKISRDLQLLGADYNPAFFAALQQNAIACGTFEVRLDSQIDHAAPDYQWSFHVKGTVKVTPLSSTHPRGPVEYVSSSGSSNSECVVTTILSTKNGEFEVDKADLTNYDPDHPGGDRVSLVTLTFTVIPTETYKSTPTGAKNCGTTTPPPYDGTLWHSGFEVHHFGFSFLGNEWLPDSPPGFASAIYPGRVLALGGGYTITENTKLEIVHTPDPPVPVPDPTA